MRGLPRHAACRPVKFALMPLHPTSLIASYSIPCLVSAQGQATAVRRLLSAWACPIWTSQIANRSVRPSLNNEESDTSINIFFWYQALFCCKRRGNLKLPHQLLHLCPDYCLCYSDVHMHPLHIMPCHTALKFQLASGGCIREGIVECLCFARVEAL
jgi:hypothetical protein